MKRAIQLTIALILTATMSNAQSVFTVTQNLVMSTGLFDDTYSNYVINIQNGATLTINMNVNFRNTTINGGTIVVNKDLRFTTSSTLNNVNVKVYGTGALENSQTLTVKNSDINFYNSSKANLAGTLDMTNSRIKLNDNSSFSLSWGTLNLRSLSSITIGDGTTSSTASANFGISSINEYDNSYITLANYNNSYENLLGYKVADQNKTINTYNNHLNCGTPGKNSCSFFGVYGPATLGTGGLSGSAILPVKLTSFGVKSADYFVDITWTTATEMNAKKFEIERSYDGQMWGTAGTVVANGNTSRESAYAFRDDLKVGGKVQYRLKMIDQDGSFVYSPIRTVNAIGKVDMNIYPNPAATYVMINTRNGSDDKLTIQLINHTGQIVKQVKGNGNTVLSVSDMTAGNYFVRVLNTNSAPQTFKLLIRK